MAWHPGGLVEKEMNGWTEQLRQSDCTAGSLEKGAGARPGGSIGLHPLPMVDSADGNAV